MKLIVALCPLLLAVMSMAPYRETLAQGPTPSPTPSWVDSPPTEDPDQYGYFAQQVKDAPLLATFKWEKETSHSTQNFPVVTSQIGGGPFGGGGFSSPVPGFDTTTTLRGVDRVRSDQTFARDLVVLVKNKPALTKRSGFSPVFDQPWSKVGGGTLTTSNDFQTVASTLETVHGVRKLTYPHPIRSFGLVSLHDFNVLTGKVHFRAPKGTSVSRTPLIVNFTFSVTTPSSASTVTTTVSACSNRPAPLKLPVMPPDGLADLTSWTVSLDTNPTATSCR
jgi:hypothetical protein